MSHTPGPWVVEQIGVGRSTYFDVLKFTDDENDAQLIARIEVDANDGGKATASLIAAAPELLAELKCVLASFADEPRIAELTYGLISAMVGSMLLDRYWEYRRTLAQNQHALELKKAEIELKKIEVYSERT